MATKTPRIRNRLLKSLSPSDLALLQLSLGPAKLPQRHYFEKPNRPIEEVCFPETAVVSVVAAQGDLEVEVGLIGFEGMTGTPLLLGSDRTTHAAYIQIAGEGLRMPA